MMTNGTFSSMVSSLFGYVDGLGFKSQLWVCEFVLYKKNIKLFISSLYHRPNWTGKILSNINQGH